MIDSLPAIITAIALVITAIASAIGAWRSGKSNEKADKIIEKTTTIADNVNGAAHVAAAAKDALLTEVETLKKQLAQLVVERKDERAASQQARADVQAGIAAPPPEPEAIR